jgi:hypothetical protein
MYSPSAFIHLLSLEALPTFPYSYIFLGSLHIRITLRREYEW